MPKLCSLLAGVLLLLSSFSLQAAPLVKAGDTVVIAGDSITQLKNYSVKIEDYLLMCQHADAKQIVQFGWVGEQAAQLLQRLDGDLYPFQPTVITLSYGMNDGHYEPLTPASGDAFRNAETALVESFKQHGVHTVVIGSPGVVDSYYFRKFQNTAPYDPALPAMYNKTLAGLSDIARDVAQKEGMPFADIHTLMMDIMTKEKAAHGEKFPFINDGDGVHPGDPGMLIMAYAYLKALGCDGNIGTISVDLFNGQPTVTATPGHTILSAKDGTIEIESTRYPFCFNSDSREILQYLPFNQDLNRFMLVVKGLTGTGAKITWGTVTKQFSTADLAKGINLAAEFLDNPFNETFNHIDHLAQDQQEQDRALVQSYLHNAKDLRAASTHPAAYDAVAKNGLAYGQSLYGLAAAAVVPLRHTLKIEPVP